MWLHHPPPPYTKHLPPPQGNCSNNEMEIVFLEKRNLSGMILEFQPIYISAHTTLLPSLVSYPKI
jgi:hypothetical protein